MYRLIANIMYGLSRVRLARLPSYSCDRKGRYTCGYRLAGDGYYGRFVFPLDRLAHRMNREFRLQFAANARLDTLIERLRNEGWL